MKQTYNIDGLTCQGCVKSASKILGEIQGVGNVQISLEKKEALIESNGFDLDYANSKLGKYQLSSIANLTSLKKDKVTLSTYKPLLLVIGFLILVSLLAQFNSGTFNMELWMRHFMGGFFLAFSFFKFLDLEGFANSFKNYDLLAKTIPGWAILYPFVELILGIGYLINFNPLIVNLSAILILGIGTIGVVKAVFDKKSIQCACLGTGFNLPMTTVTIVENGVMILMAFMVLMG